MRGSRNSTTTTLFRCFIELLHNFVTLVCLLGISCEELLLLDKTASIDTTSKLGTISIIYNYKGTALLQDLIARLELPGESLTLLVKNCFIQVVLDPARALVAPHVSLSHYSSPSPLDIGRAICGICGRFRDPEGGLCRGKDGELIWPQKS